MPQTSLFKAIVQLSVDQYNDLRDNGSIEVGGQTILYDPESTLYITEQGSNISMDDQDNSAAIGNGSSALGLNTVQLGAGTNTTPNTLQYLNLTVIDADGQVPDARLTRVFQGLNGKELSSNKVTSLSNLSTDTEYPSAKCVYDLVGDIESLLTNLNTGGGV